MSPVAPPCCQVCGDPVEPGLALACRDCGAPHHPDCHAYTGRCSIYGCLGTSTLPFAGGETGVLAIDASTRGPAPPAAWAGFDRKLAKAARSWAWTVPLAVGASALPVGIALLTYPGLQLFAGPFPLNMVFVGLLIGLGAPLLGPTLHRRPGELLRLAMGWQAIRVGLQLTVLNSLPMVVAMAISVVSILATAIFGVACAELAAGPRRGPGEVGRKERFMIALVAMATLSMLLNLVFTPLSMAIRNLPWALTNGLWLAVATFPALERGKEEYREALPPARR